jgi:hypothetical protein|eukprot:Tamp_08306.p1 GENE.Tamp_08306~~Tamp_08306.p1  ORF type:complete len:700 (+),score=112.95 Tamp_08306:29-2128(+)
MGTLEEAQPRQAPGGRGPGEPAAEAPSALPSIGTHRRQDEARLGEAEGASSPRYVLCAEEMLPSLPGRRRRPDKLAVVLQAADVQNKMSALLGPLDGVTHFAVPHPGDSGRAALSLLVSPKKSPRKEAVLRQASSAQRPSSAAGSVRYCTSADVGGALAGDGTRTGWIRVGPAAEHSGRADDAGMNPGLVQASRTRRTLLIDAESAGMCSHESVPSTPRLPSGSASREPSMRVRRAWLREAAGCRTGTGASHPPQSHAGSHIPSASPAGAGEAGVGGHEAHIAAEARQWSAGGSNAGRPARASAAWPRQWRTPRQGLPAQHRPLSAASSDTVSTPSAASGYDTRACTSYASTPTRRRTAGDVARQGTPRLMSPHLMSPRVFGDVNDALKERCTSALTSTLRDMPEIKDEHKSQIMNSYCHEVCVALQDHDGLRRENILVVHRQEKEALRRALLAERERQAQILEHKLAQRRRDKVAAAEAAAAAAVDAARVSSHCVAKAVEVGGAGGQRRAKANQEKEADGRCTGHRCDCVGERNADGECVDCDALRFGVKHRDIGASLRAVSTLLVRQAALFPSLRDRLEPGWLLEGACAGAGGLRGKGGGVEGVEEGQGRGDALGGGRGRKVVPKDGDRMAEGQAAAGVSKHARGAASVRPLRPATAGGVRASDTALPEGWLVRTSRSTGKTFYYHPASNSTQWERP